MDFVKHPKDKTLFVAVRLRQFVYYLAILFIISPFNLMVIGFLWWYFLLAGSRVPCSSLFVRLAESSPLHGFDIDGRMERSYWPALRAGLLCCNFGQPGSVSKFPPFVWVKLWVGWVGRGYTEISRYFPASWINWVTLVTKIKLLYSLRF